MPEAKKDQIINNQEGEGVEMEQRISFFNIEKITDKDREYNSGDSEWEAHQAVAKKQMEKSTEREKTYEAGYETGANDILDALQFPHETKEIIAAINHINAKHGERITVVDISKKNQGYDDRIGMSKANYRHIIFDRLDLERQEVVGRELNLSKDDEYSDDWRSRLVGGDEVRIPFANIERGLGPNIFPGLQLYGGPYA